MRLQRIVGHRLRSLFRRARVDAELQRELEVHIEQLTKEHIAGGMPERDARLAARREFGSVEWTMDQCRDVRRVSLIEELIHDIGYAGRLLRKSPGFTFTAVCSLALGIGATTAIFSIVNTFLLRPLPFDHPERLVTVWERNVGGNDLYTSVAPGNFLDWQSASTRFEQLSAVGMRSLTMTGDSPASEPQRIMVCTCSGNLFATLGVAPIAGRSFRPEEDRWGAPRVVVIGYNLWQRQFAGSPSVVGQRIRLNEQAAEVIGVMPSGFTFPNLSIDAWMPILTTMPPTLQARHDLHNLLVVGRVRESVPPQQALAEVDALAARYKSAHPNESTAKGASIQSLHEFLVQDARTPLVILLAAVLCVLLIACVNIANLMLTRATVRGREIGIRTALGAGRGRIVRQLMTETILLGLAGGVAGLALAVWIAKLLVLRAPGADGILQSATVPLDATVFAFAFTTAVATGVAVGLMPAIRGSRADVTTDLKNTTRSSTAGRAQGRFRDTLVTVEIALSLVLLVAAGLLFHSFSRLYRVEPGIRLDHMLAMSTSLPNARYGEASRRSAFLATLGDGIRALPGVISAGLTSCTPLTGACNNLFFYIEGRPYVPGKFLIAHERSVDAQYFRAAGIRLLKGRGFTAEDGVGFDAAHPRPGTILISETMARSFFGGEEPLGKRIFFDFEVQRERNEGFPAPRYQIVGVVSDVLPTLDGRMQPTLYRPLLDVPANGVTVLMHTTAAPQSVVAVAKDEIHRLDPALVTYQVRTMDDLVEQSTSSRRFTMLLFVSFAGLALSLAAVGLYGVVSYTVSQRTTEIGIRMALGASSSDVNRLVVMQGLKPALAGIVFGVAGAAFASRLFQSLLFGVTPADPLTFALVPPALLIVAALACYLPGRRASRLDPTVALRAD